MTIIGAYARVCDDHLEAARRGLAAVVGVTVFDLERPGAIGLLVEAASVDLAHAVLTQDLPAVEGVLGILPVYVNDDAEDA